MLDQAHDLRRLATTGRGDAQSPSRGGRPTLIVVAGGKGGVGTTTVALNLAAALVQTGRRAVLVDADLRGGDAATVCGVEPRYTLADVLANRRKWNEALCDGPDGTSLVVGHAGWLDGGNPSAAARALLDRLDRPDFPADLAIIDAGSGPGGILPYLGPQADAVVLVTTGDAASVVGTFAAIKRMAGDGSAAPPHVVANMTAGVEAQTIHYRLVRTCRRMLGIELPSVGLVASSTRQRGQNGTVSFSLTRKSGQSPEKCRLRPIRLNLQASSADSVRRVWVAESLLNWLIHTKIASRKMGRLQRH
jgi:flagellar biosynthesis protein FlhG